MITKKGKWSQAEVRKLRDGIIKSDIKQLSDELGRSSASIRKKAIEIGIKVTVREFCNWSDDEVELLKRLYPNQSTKEISVIMNRTVSSIEQKAIRIGLKKSYEYLEKSGLIFESKEWSHAEINYLKEHYQIKSLTGIAKDLNRPFTAVAQKAHRLGLKRVSRPGWSKEQINLIRESFHLDDVECLAKAIGRSAQSVRQKAHRLGLKRHIQNAPNTDVMHTAAY